MPEVYKVSYYDADDELRQALFFYLKVEDNCLLDVHRRKVLDYMGRRDSRKYRPNTFHKSLEYQKMTTPHRFLPFHFAYETKPAYEVNKDGVINTLVRVKKEDKDA